MRVLSKPTQEKAFTLTELMVIVLMLALLFGLLVPTLYHAKDKSRRIGCVSNLKNLGLAFRIFATDHGDRIPMAFSTNQTDSAEREAAKDVVRHFRAMSNELNTPKILACPADDRKAALDFIALRHDNVSYFLGLDADETLPRVLLAGDRNLTVNGAALSSGVFDLTTNMAIGWTKELHRFRGQVLVGDGSVQHFSPTQLNSWFGASGVATNRLVIP